MEAAKVRLKQPATRQKQAARAQLSSSAKTASAGVRWLTGIIVGGALLIPLIVSVYGEDPFRYPKDLALRLEVILIAVVLALVWAFGRLRLPPLHIRQTWVALTAAICAWTIICALLSTNRLVSLPPTIRVLEYALLFVVTVLVMHGRPAWFAGLIVPAAIVNALVYMLQELDVWSPFATDIRGGEHLTRTALLGNPNDVGSYLVVPALVATALALSQRRWRFVWGLAAALIVAATFMTHTVAAIGALIVAVPVLVALRLRSWPKTIAALLAGLVLAGGAFAMYKPLRDRAFLMRDALVRRDFEAFSAARTIPFFTAVEMTRNRPIFGVGPGCFAYNFFEYKLRVQQKHRWLRTPGMTEYNFGEVHNDHLQVASETGLPGYALFLAALVLLALPSWQGRTGGAQRSEEEQWHAELAPLLALPLAVSMFVLALAQFPLELAAPRLMFLTLGALCIAWSRDDAT